MISLISIVYVSKPVNASMNVNPWGVSEQVFYKSSGAEVYSGIERISENFVIGVGSEQSANPDIGCWFIYAIGDTLLRRDKCKEFNGIGFYDVYSPWRNGSALVVGWRDPSSLEPSGVFVYRYDASTDKFTNIITYDDPDYSDERMTMIIGFTDPEMIVVAGSVYNDNISVSIKAIYGFKHTGQSWTLAWRIVNHGSLIFRNDNNGEQRLYSVEKGNGVVIVSEISLSDGSIHVVASIDGLYPTIFHSIDVIGNDVLGVTNSDDNTIKLWTPVEGVFYTYKLKENYNSISVKASHYGENYALIYGYNNKDQWKGPVYVTNLAGMDRGIGKYDWRLKWSTYAPTLLLKNYLVASTARGFSQGIITVYELNNIVEPTTTSQTTTQSTTSNSQTPNNNNTGNTGSTTTTTNHAPSMNNTTNKDNLDKSSNNNVNENSTSEMFMIISALVILALIAYVVFTRIKH